MADGGTKRNAFIDRLIEELALDGARAIQIAYSQREFKDRSYNLHDSYASAVYLDGSLLDSTISYVTKNPKARILDAQEVYSKKLNIYGYNKDRTRPLGHLMGLKGDERILKGDTLQTDGRAEAKRFLLDYGHSIKGTKGIQLVVVASMFYASVLERGSGGFIRRKYKVITSALNYMRDLKNRKYKGSELYNLDFWRNLDVAQKGAFKIKPLTPIL